MDDFPHIPDLSPLRHRRYGVHRRFPRTGIRDSIENARTTLLINLAIEVLAGLILLVGIGYTVKYLFLRRSVLGPARFNLFIEIIIFFTIGWFTYIGFKVRKKYLLLKKHRSRSSDSPRNTDESL